MIHGSHIACLNNIQVDGQTRVTKKLSDFYLSNGLSQRKLQPCYYDKRFALWLRTVFKFGDQYIKIHKKNVAESLSGIPLINLIFVPVRISTGFTQSSRCSVTYEHRGTRCDLSLFICNIHAGSNPIKSACISDA